jgi:CheY-like chemotaxis protein
VADDAPLAPAPRALAAVNDLFFEAKLGEVLRASGVPVAFVKTAEGLERRLEEGRPLLALVDMGARGLDGEAAIRRLRALDAALPILAFHSHVDEEARARARDAGATDAWAKSRLARELPEWIARHAASAAPRGPAAGGA